MESSNDQRLQLLEDMMEEQRIQMENIQSDIIAVKEEVLQEVKSRDLRLREEFQRVKLQVIDQEERIKSAFVILNDAAAMQEYQDDKDYSNSVENNNNCKQTRRTSFSDGDRTSEVVGEGFNE